MNYTLIHGVLSVCFSVRRWNAEPEKEFDKIKIRMLEMYKIQTVIKGCD